ncbi:MAG TPA: hypothetical protein VFQ53_04610 [Kofleriaceae bacterium]|nr:hypothetical protein [Kofleriaceae bacterium]
MAKKHKHKKHKTKHVYRNTAPASAPRAPRAPRAKTGEDTSTRRLLYTAAGAGGTALVGSFLARQGWAPKTVAGALAAVGTGLAWKGDGSMIQSVGAGAMSAAGSQLALMLIDDRDRKAPAATTAKKPANADELPPGALENALERARTRLALATSDLPDDDMA